MFVDGFDNVSGRDPVFRQAWLDDLKKYNGGIRFMDFCYVNFYAATFNDGTWASRRQPTDPHQGTGVALEYMIKAANLTHQNAWFNVPHIADDNYIRQMATLIYTTLDTSLICYIEWSNEVWNYGFPVTSWSAEQGTKAGIPGDELRRIFRYSVYAHMNVFKIFEEVFKDAPQRLVKVQAGWFGHDCPEVQIAAFTDPICNPHGVVVDAYAVAPYFVGANGDGAVDLVAQATVSIKEQARNVARCRKVLDSLPATYTQGKRIKLFCYEGGQHYTKNSDVAAKNPAMYDLYTMYFDSMSQYVDEFFHYTDNTSWGGAAWGAKWAIGLPDSVSPKFMAIMDWIKKHPAPASRATTPAAGKGAQRAAAASPRLRILPVQATVAGQEIYLLNGAALRASSRQTVRGVCVIAR